MDNLFPNNTGSSGFTSVLMNRLMREHPRETDLVVTGGLTVFCAIAFFQKLKKYLIHSDPTS